MKHAKRNSIIILILTIIFLYFLLKDNFSITINSLKEANIIWIIIAIIVYFIYLIFDSLVLHIICKLYKPQKFKYILRLGIMTKFFNGITPLASGGQPLQVIEMKKRNISYTDGTSIIAGNLMLFQIVLVIFSLIAIILNQIFHIFTKVKFLKHLTILGFIVNLVLLLVLLYISFSKKFSKKIIDKTIHFLHKIKIVKDEEKVKESWDLKRKNYSSNANHLLKNKKTIVYGMIYYTISLILYHSIPYFVMLSLGATKINIIKVIIASCYAYIMSCYIPIPGAAGGTEICYLGIMSNFTEDPILTTSLIIWRFITYYLPTTIGAVVFNLRKNKES